MSSLKLFSRIKGLNKTNQFAHKSQQHNERLILSCRNTKLNHYEHMNYDKLREVPLASKGWHHRKSFGDHFTIQGDPQARDHPHVPFSKVNLSPNIEKILKEQQINALTSFQSEAIPAIRTENHTLIAAETGCGKTLAYLIPLVEKLMQSSPTDKMNTPKILILVPSRELAIQIGNVASTLCSGTDLKTKVIVGGRTKRLMLQSEYSQIDIMVATPGAISKLSTVGLYKLNDVKHTVIDEADTMLDDSFLDRLETLTKRVSSSQIILCSATKPRELPAVLEPIMETLVQIESPWLHRPLVNVTQKFVRLSKSSKSSQLLQIAKSCKDPMIIFTNKNETCNWLALFLRENGVRCANINGDMKYDIRIEQWNGFQSGDVNILSATDVGSRGLDTTMLKQLLNYDFPIHTADYIHRVGRIGRLGSLDDGKITNFVAGVHEVKLVQNIELAIRTGSELKHVDGNITNIVQKRILKSMRGAA